jgi:hypothetical protein
MTKAHYTTHALLTTHYSLLITHYFHTALRTSILYLFLIFLKKNILYEKTTLPMLYLFVSRKTAFTFVSAWTKLFSMNFDKVKELCQSKKQS